MPELPELIKPDAPKAAKSRKKTSKTARVLGLLTSALPAEEGSPSGGREGPVSSPASVPLSPPPVPTPSDQAVEQQIRGALERELESELATQEASLSPAPPGSSRSAGNPSGFRPVSIEPAPAATGGLTCLNVMQLLVEAKVDKYIQLFGLCPCPRCRIDVIALTLTSLPAKYVVAREPQTSPLLSVYEEKFNAAVVSQLMNACKVVLEHPRHDS